MAERPFAVPSLVADTSTLFIDSPNDRVGIGTVTPSVRLEVVGQHLARASAASDVPLTVRGAASQSAALQVWEDSAGADVAFVSAAGVLTAVGGLVGLATAGPPASSLADGATAVDTTNGVLYFRSGGAWVPVVSGSSLPADLSLTTLRLTATSDASLSSTGHALQVGPTAGANVIVDGNEIMARNNGGASTLFLNADGGAVSCGGTISGDGSGITAVAERAVSSPSSFAAATTSGTTSITLATWTNIGVASVQKSWIFNFNLRLSTTVATDRFVVTLNDTTAGTVLQNWVVGGVTTAVSYTGGYSFNRTGVFSLSLTIARTSGTGTATIVNSASDNFSTASVVGVRT